MMLHEIDIEYAAYTLSVTYSETFPGQYDIERIDLKDPKDIGGLMDCCAAAGGINRWKMWDDIDKRLETAIKLQAYDNARTIEDVS
jgi:hypothetical protein